MWAIITNNVFLQCSTVKYMFYSIKSFKLMLLATYKKFCMNVSSDRIGLQSVSQKRLARMKKNFLIKNLESKKKLVKL